MLKKFIAGVLCALPLAEFAAALSREIPQWARVIKQAGIKAE